MSLRLDSIPPAPRAIPDWYIRLELKPRQRKFVMFFIAFLTTLGLFSFFTARQLSFELLKKKSQLLSGKVIQISGKSFQFEIFVETNENDFHYVLQEKNVPFPPSLKVGDVVSVYFVSSNPSRSVSQYSAIDYRLYILFSFPLSAFFFFIAISTGRMYFQRRDAYQQGEPIKAKITQWEEKSGKYQIRLQALEIEEMLENDCWLPRYVNRVAPETEIKALYYNRCLAYYWTAEEGLST